MRNYTEIRFSDTTGNGKFSGKLDLPSEFFFLGPDSIPVPAGSPAPLYSLPTSLPALPLVCSDRSVHGATRLPGCFPAPLGSTTAARFPLG